jgi:hypothetical protein
MNDSLEVHKYLFYGGLIHIPYPLFLIPPIRGLLTLNTKNQVDKVLQTDPGILFSKSF